MKTSELIRMLGTNVEPVGASQLRTALFIALTIGTAVALCLMLVLFGAPDAAFGAEYLGIKTLALAFTLGLAAAGASFLLKAARPGKLQHGRLAVIGLIAFGALLAGIVTMILSRPNTWGELVFGPQWAACLICIPLFAAAPFASLIWALRKDAPTHLRWTSAMAGMVAGALGAAAYTFHNPAGSIPFIVLWYGGLIITCTLLGALLGPRLLRW